MPFSHKNKIAFLSSLMFPAAVSVAIEVWLSSFSPSPPGPDGADEGRCGRVLLSSESVQSVREG